MMKPRVSTTTGQAEIAPDEPYADGYQGVMNGSFTLNEARETVSNTPLKVTSPDELSDSYRGVINGSASVPDPSKDYVVRAYLKTDSEYEQDEAVGGSVQADGSWTIDTTSVGDYSGSWALRLYEVESDTQVGLSWPRPVQYKDLAIRYYLLTGGLYIQSEQEAQASGRWSFTANNNEGDKVFEVVDTKTGDILAEHVKLESTGMIRSYEYLPGIDGYGTSREQNSYTYDQALALMVAIAHGDKDMADELLGGLELIQVTEGELAGAFP